MIGTEGRSQRAARARAASPNKQRRHPTTSDVEYTDPEIEFMAAIQHFKHTTGRAFPTWREVLGVVNSLGYVRDPDTSIVRTKQWL